MNRNNQTYHGQKIVISFVEFFHPKTFSWQKFFLLKIFQDELVISYYPTCFINNVIVSNVTYLNEFICDVIDLQQYLNQIKTMLYDLRQIVNTIDLMILYSCLMLVYTVWKYISNSCINNRYLIRIWIMQYCCIRKVISHKLFVRQIILNVMAIFSTYTFCIRQKVVTKCNFFMLEIEIDF